MTVDSELDPSRLKKAGGRPATFGPEDLLKVLPAAGLSNKDWQEAAEHEGIGRATFFRLKKALDQQNKVVLGKVSNLWQPIKTG
jgi:hypothetical protein